MKSLACMLLILACSVSLRADILANASFADGKAHWKGDAKEIDTNNLSAGAQPGVTVTLKKDKWTKIYQTFTSKEKKLDYSVSFTLSPDYHVEGDTPGSSSGSMSGPSPGLDDIEGMYPIYGYAYGGRWTLIVDAFGGGGYGHFYLKPDLTKKDSQTLTGKIQGFNGGNGGILILAFPPGEGTITLSNVSLAPTEEQ